MLEYLPKGYISLGVVLIDVQKVTVCHRVCFYNIEGLKLLYRTKKNGTFMHINYINWVYTSKPQEKKQFN